MRRNVAHASLPLSTPWLAREAACKHVRPVVRARGAFARASAAYHPSATRATDAADAIVMMTTHQTIPRQEGFARWLRVRAAAVFRQQASGTEYQRLRPEARKPGIVAQRPRLRRHPCRLPMWQYEPHQLPRPRPRRRRVTRGLGAAWPGRGPGSTSWSLVARRRAEHGSAMRGGRCAV